MVSPHVLSCSPAADKDAADTANSSARRSGGCLRGLAQIITDIDVQHVFVDGQDVLTWYYLHTRVAPPTPTANWSHIEDGKIITIQATFDPREIV